MTATQISVTPACQVGDRVQVRRTDTTTTPGRISSIHRRENGVDYVVRTDPSDGGTGGVVNLGTMSGQSSLLRSAPAGGASR